MEHEQGSDIAVRDGKDDREKWIAIVDQVQKEEFCNENKGGFFPQNRSFGKIFFYLRDDLLEEMEEVIIFKKAEQWIRICCTDKTFSNIFQASWGAVTRVLCVNMVFGCC